VTFKAVGRKPAALVIWFSDTYIVVPVAANARRLSPGKGRVRVTGDTTEIRMPRGQREFFPVREIRRLPIRDRRIVAGLAGNRKPSHGMAGIRRCRKIFAVARNTSGLKTRKLSVRMARLAIHKRMTARQRKTRGRMLRLHRHPLVPAIGRVALLTAIAELAGVNISVTTNTRRYRLRKHQSRVARLT